MKQQTTQTLKKFKVKIILAAYLLVSFISFKSNAQQIYESENATLFRATVQSNHAGYTGSGFADYDNVIGSYIEWSVNVANQGVYRLEYRYANGSASNRPAEVKVNNAIVLNNLNFNPTGGWANWQLTAGFTVSLNAGVNTIRATALVSSGGANVDHLVVTPVAEGNALLIENLSKFPNNEFLTFSRIQRVHNGNYNHDRNTIRISNTGSNPIVIKELRLSSADFVVEKLNGVDYAPATMIPYTLNAGQSADITIRFAGIYDNTLAIRIIDNTLTIVTDAEEKIVSLRALWQRYGEGNNEPTAAQIMRAFGFTTSTGFVLYDPDKGNPSKPKGDEILSAFFERVDPSQPVTIRQMAAYHTCCANTETIKWYLKGSTSESTVFTHHGSDGQTLLPRHSNGGLGQGSFNPSGPFGLKSAQSYTDPSRNYAGKLGLRTWIAKDANGVAIPNSYIMSMDYVSSTANFDYNDNMYYVTNIKPAAVSVASASTYGGEDGIKSAVENIEVSPVPSEGIVNIRTLSSNTEIDEISIYKSTGPSAVYNKKVSGRIDEEIDLKRFGRGLYMCHLKVKGGVVSTRKIVIQ